MERNYHKLQILKTLPHTCDKYHRILIDTPLEECLPIAFGYIPGMVSYSETRKVVQPSFWHVREKFIFNIESLGNFL